jgi:hypothetical protein
MNIVFVHGIAQQDKSSEIIAREWLGALNKGRASLGLPPLENGASTKFFVPFYGKILFDAVESESVADRKKRSEDFSDFAMEYGAEALGTTKKSMSDLAESSTRATHPDLQKKGPQNWPIVTFLAREIDKHWSGRVTEAFIGRFLRDVHLYLTDEKVRKKVDDIVVGQLPTDAPTLVVGHSLGSVVAYHVLSSYQKEVKLFVTVGSPLAIHAVRKRLKPQPAIPGCLPNWNVDVHASWYNAFDRNDIVALNPLDDAHFGAGLHIENNGLVRNSSDNHHNIVPYLADEKVAKRIAGAF